MCGIAGIIFKSKNQTFEKFKNSVTLMSHRGPDNFGEYLNGNMALYHYRLSILDLSKDANQPFCDSFEGNQLVYNGEVYNFKELKRKHQLLTKTSSDTEVVYQLLKKNINNVSEFNGVFSIAHYDPLRGVITLFRDRLGVKPLYYINHEDYFAFASEAKVLMDYLDHFDVNYQVLHEFLTFGSSISTQTMVDSIQKVKPGTVLEFDIESLTIKEKVFWSVETNIIGRNEVEGNYEKAKVKTRLLLEAAVQRQCISDVPVGAYLSGGIDSSVVVALASKYSSTKLNTFSVSFDKNPKSELKLARKIANIYKTNHHEFVVETKNIMDDLEGLLFQYDEPFADPAAIPLHLMAKQNHGITKVVLQGDGGDELFAGYGRHLDCSQLRQRKIASKLLSILHPNKSFRKRMFERSWVLNRSPSWQRMGRQVSRYQSVSPEDVLGKELLGKNQAINALLSYQETSKSLTQLDPLQEMLYTDMQIILPNTYLEKVDKVNMWHSIEARVPLLDNELVDYVMRLPSKYKLQNGITKSFFREVVSDLLPNEILSGRKVSFGTPMNEWLRTTLYSFAKSLFEVALVNNHKILNIKFLIKKLESHQMRKEENGDILWRSIVLLIWLNTYKDKLNSI